MKMYDLGLTIIVGIVIGAIVIGIAASWFGGDGNEIEIIAEDVIKEETGLDINLDTHHKEKIA